MVLWKCAANCFDETRFPSPAFGSMYCANPTARRMGATSPPSDTSDSSPFLASARHAPTILTALDDETSPLCRSSSVTRALPMDSGTVRTMTL